MRGNLYLSFFILVLIFFTTSVCTYSPPGTQVPPENVIPSPNGPVHSIPKRLRRSEAEIITTEAFSAAEVCPPVWSYLLPRVEVLWWEGFGGGGEGKG